MENQEIDRQIAEKVMGFYLPIEEKGNNIWWSRGDGKRFLFNPSTNIVHAFEVVGRMDDCLHLRQHGAIGNWSAFFCGHLHGHKNGSSADTPEMAICKAALRAVEGKQEHRERKPKQEHHGTVVQPLGGGSRQHMTARNNCMD